MTIFLQKSWAAHLIFTLFMTHSDDPCEAKCSSHPSLFCFFFKMCQHRSLIAFLVHWKVCLDVPKCWFISLMPTFLDSARENYILSYLEFLYYLKFYCWEFFSLLLRSGDTDAVVPMTATRYSIDALWLRTIVNRYPWYDNREVSD